MKHINDEDNIFETINGKKILRDGKRYRSGPVTMMDGYQRMLDGRPARITDATGGNRGLHRPGYRIFDFDDAAARDTREAAHREYVDYITNAYKQPQRVRDQDIRAGEPGLIGHDEPTHFSRPRITDGAGNSDEFAFSRPGYRILADAAAGDARETAYAEYLADLTNAWRTKPPRV
jgi:hypothetical protein